MEYVLPCQLLSSANGELTLQIEGKTVAIPLPATAQAPSSTTGALWLTVKDTPPATDLLNELLSS